MLVFGASVQHQALNAPHFLYSYIPHRPTLLRRWMPATGRDLTWSWILGALPTLQEAQEVYLLSNLLAKPSDCTLLPLARQGDPYPDLASRFASDLETLSRKIRRRGRYPYLDPASVACSIDI